LLPGPQGEGSPASAPRGDRGVTAPEKTTRAEQIDMLDMLAQHYDDRMTSWECDFVAHNAVRMGAGESLTEKQAATLEEIFDRRTEHGRSGGHVSRRQS
jgi:hypothetical protein